MHNPAGRLLSRYFSRILLASIGRLLVLVTLVILLLDGIETIRRTAHKEHFSPIVLLELVLAKLPFLLFELSPIIVFLGACLGFWLLARHQEFHTARAFGLTLPQLLLPGMAWVLVLGLGVVGLGQPLAAGLITHQRDLEARVLEQAARAVVQQKSRLWVVENIGDGQRILKGRNLVPALMRIRDPVVLWIDGQGVERTALGEEARLEGSNWNLHRVRLYRPDQPVEYLETLRLPTSITARTILRSYGTPDTTSFWNLPGLVRDFRASGADSLSWLVRWVKLATLPLLMAIMVLLAAPLGRLRARQSRPGRIILRCVLAGFALYFFGEVMRTLAVTGGIPVVLAALLQLGVPALIGLGLLARHEKA